MARRKRLTPPAAGPGADPAPAARPAAAPIAQTAGEAAAEQARAIARLTAEAEAGRDAAGRLAAAETEGRMLTDLPLTAVETGYIPRDRIPRVDEDDAFRALKLSLDQRGQQVPIEVVALGDGRFGLVAGWRRMQALRQMHFRTGEARFATVRALVRPAGARAEAFRAMVEENEIRADLSHYERGRICALAAGAGAFDSPEAAVDALFAAASPARRSKIRSFVAVHAALGDLLAWPEKIPERLGLALAKALKWGRADALRAALEGQAPRWRGPADEQAALKAALERRPQPGIDPPAGLARPPHAGTPGAATGRGTGRTGSRRGPDPTRGRVVALAPGLRLEQRSYDNHTDLRLSGPDLDADAVDAAIAILRAQFSGKA